MSTEEARDQNNGIVEAFVLVKKTIDENRRRSGLAWAVDIVRKRAADFMFEDVVAGYMEGFQSGIVTSCLEILRRLEARIEGEPHDLYAEGFADGRASGLRDAPKGRYDTILFEQHYAYDLGNYGSWVGTYKTRWLALNAARKAAATMHRPTLIRIGELLPYEIEEFGEGPYGTPGIVLKAVPATYTEAER